ncbi:hypothetical protein EJB05_49143, partial [Eragrostis curvula]
MDVDLCVIESNFAMPWIWAYTWPIKGFLCQISEQNVRGWLSVVMKHLSHGDLTRVVVILWAIWHARRKAIHESNFQSPLSTHCFINRYVSELEMSLPPVKEKSKNQTVMPKWIPPPSGLAKVNIVDAALSKNRSIAACAAVARSKTGEFLGASVVVMDGIMNAEVSEALACGEGMALARDIVLRRFRLASNCQMVIRNIHGNGMGQYGQIVCEIKRRANDFSKVEYVHEGRR